MGWKQWTAVVVVIGGGVLLQIPDYGAMDGGTMDESRADGIATDALDAPAVLPPFTRVALDVTGMT